MAPIRRYVRITKYSVLECHIFLDNPTLGESWLLNRRRAVLPRVMKSVFPLIAPKLREEYERSRGKSTKRRSVKDTIVEDDFEVSIFLTQTRTRHSLLTKQKHFYNSKKKDIISNSGKLFGGSENIAADIESEPVIIHEESSVAESIQALSHEVTAEAVLLREKSEQNVLKRAREVVTSESSSNFEPPCKRRKGQNSLFVEDEDEVEEKKMSIHTTYEGFTVYGRVLCLVIRRRDIAGKDSSESTSHATMENWISSTQPMFESETIAD